MSFPIWPSAFVARFTAVTAAFLNQIRTQIASAIDGGGGGTYAPSPAIAINGDGLKVGGSGIELQGTGKLKRTSGQIIRIQPLAGVDGIATGDWVRSSAGWQNDVDTPGFLVVPLTRLVHGAVLDEVHSTYKANSGHAAFPGGAPGTMPTMELWRITDATGALTQIGSTTTDTSASAAAFQAAHDIAQTSIAHTIDLTIYSYQIIVRAETGANYIAGAILSSVKTLMTVTTIPED